MAAGEPDGRDPLEHPVPPAAAPQWPVRPRTGSGPTSVNETVLRRLIDVLADGIVLADEDGRIVLANRRAAAMFGYSHSELAGQRVESLIPASLRDVHRLDRAAYALKPVARPMADRARLVGLRKDGTTLPVTITLSPVPTATWQFVLAVVRDATQEHRQDDLTDVVHGVIAEQAHHAGELLDRVVGNLLHVGLSIDTAAGQPQSVPIRSPRGITDRPWTWTHQPALVTGSIESAANAMTVPSSDRSGSSRCPRHTASLWPSR